MKTLDELASYCDEKEPVGALMLTGEWGCGKTYLIKHNLKDELNKRGQILVHVSLFGVDSIDALHLSVKKNWAQNCLGLFGKIEDRNGLVNTGRSVFGIVSTFVPYLKDIKDSILAINPYEYLEAKNVVGNDDNQKRVVLVFDDLERSKLDIIDILGCINDYCENKGFNAIIVANEEKINKIDSTFKYDEIKEKIVERTIKYQPEYSQIVHSIINKKQWDNQEYTTFLKENEQVIIGFFQTEVNTDDNKESSMIELPHNIRILKCGLQDFQRVYLKICSLECCERYLYSFLAFYVAHRSKILSGKALFGKEIKNLYPRFDQATLTDTARKWIIEGIWDEREIDTEVEEIKERLKAEDPKDILRTNRFMDVDEEIIYNGFSDLLQDCYNGLLSLNEYVNFIDNSYRIREFKIAIPEEIQWDKVREGIRKRIEENISHQDDEGHHYQGISEDYQKALSPDERNSYKMIKEHRDSEIVVYEKNRQQYIESFKKDGLKAFSVCRLKKYRLFDKEMAEATLYCFEKCEQSDKAMFKAYFKELWQNCDDDLDLEKEESRNGFNELKSQLQVVYDGYKSDNKPIKAEHTHGFILVVDEIIEKLDRVITLIKTQRGVSEDGDLQ